MGKEKFDLEADGVLGGMSREGVEASSAQEAREIGDKELDEALGDTTPGAEDVVSATNEATGEVTNFN